MFSQQSNRRRSVNRRRGAHQSRNPILVGLLAFAVSAVSGFLLAVPVGFVVFSLPSGSGDDAVYLGIAAVILLCFIAALGVGVWTIHRLLPPGRRRNAVLTLIVVPVALFIVFVASAESDFPDDDQGQAPITDRLLLLA